jgi:hypothetical protein
LDEHELIHAYTSFVALPAAILQEGIAQGLLCGESYFPVTVEVPPWQTAVSVFPMGRLDVYNAAFFLFVQLVQRFGIDAFMDYYRKAHRTLDAEVFRADFEAFWGTPLDSFWQGLRQSRDGLPKISPLCPCTQTPTLPVDGTRFDIAARDYWTVGDNDLVPPDQVFPLPDSDPGPYMIIADGSTSLRNCWQDRTFDLWGAKLAAPGALTIARLAPERHYVGKIGVDATTIAVTKGGFIATSCDQASAIAGPSDASGEIIVRIAAGGAAQPAANEWYWKVSVGNSPNVTISPSTMPSTTLDVCPSCDLNSSACVRIPSGTDDVIVNATTPELVFHVVNPPDGYYLGIDLTLSNPVTNPNPSP